MKKLFKLITIIIIFILSFTIFSRAAAFISKGQKSHMAKLV